MKRFVAFMMVLAMMTVFHWAIAEEEPEYKNIKIEVNGERIILLDEEEEQQKSIIADGKIYVPIEYFVNAIGGTFVYNEAENQIRIILDSTDEQVSGAADTSYSDSDIEAILPAGRWTCTTEAGTSFFDFASDHTGRITGLLDCSWTVKDGVVSVDFTSQGQEWHMQLTFEALGSTLQLVDDQQVFVLNGSTDAMINIIGTWNSVNDPSTQLVINADATCQMKVSGLVYAGTWSMDQNHIYLTQNGSTIAGNYNGTSIGLNIGGQNFTFSR